MAGLGGRQVDDHEKSPHEPRVAVVQSRRRSCRSLLCRRCLPRRVNEASDRCRREVRSPQRNSAHLEWREVRSRQWSSARMESWREVRSRQRNSACVESERASERASAAAAPRGERSRPRHVAHMESWREVRSRNGARRPLEERWGLLPPPLLLSCVAPPRVGAHFPAAVTPGGVVLQCVQQTWLPEKVDALTRHTLRGRPHPGVAGSRGLLSLPCRLSRVALPRVGALPARGSGPGRRRPTRLAADLDAKESRRIDAPRLPWTAAPRGRAMSRRALCPRKCGTGAGGSSGCGTGAAADAGACRGGPRPSGVRQWRRRRRCRCRRGRPWRWRRGGCRHRRWRWRRRWCGGRWRWRVCGRMGGCGCAPSQGVFNVPPFKRRQASGKEVFGWLCHGRGCGVCARVSRAHCRRRGCGHCERVALSRMHLHPVHVVCLVSAV